MENLENNNQVINTLESQIKAVDPQHNMPIPSALEERIAQQGLKAKGPKAKVVWLVLVVVLLVLVGVGGFWYYAQGQAWLLLRQAKWTWGEGTLENYQQDISWSLLVDAKNNTNVFLGGEKIDINLDSEQKNIASNLESDTNLKIKSEDLNLIINAKTKKIDDKFYLFFDAGDTNDLFGGLIPIPDFGDAWLATDIKNSYNVSLDKEKAAQVNLKFDEFFDKLMSDRIFDISDLKNDQNGFRKIQLNLKEDKAESFVLASINYVTDIYEIVVEPDKNSLVYKDYKEENIKNFEKMKSEKPAEWEKMRKALVSIDFMILLDEDTKIIHGLELYLNNVVFDSSSSSTTFSGNIKYSIKSIEAYQISKPTNIREIGNWQEIFMPKADMATDFSTSTSDIDSDQDGLSDIVESLYGTEVNNADSDGDGYLDGQEVYNGYNPLGEGSLNQE